MYHLLRICLKAFPALLLLVAFSVSQNVRAQGVGSVLISEFRYQGPGGTHDEYIEIYNNTDAPINIGGWGLYDESGAAIKVIPAGAVIPARGHYLLTRQGSQYCMSSYAKPDTTYTAVLANDKGIALFRNNIRDAANRIDSVGTVNTTSALFREGSGLPAIGNTGTSVEYAWVRKKPMSNGGFPQDSDDNAADFILVSTDAAFINSLPSTLGAPGPESMVCQVPANYRSLILSQLLDPAVASNSSPNFVRDTTEVGANKSLGTLILRRTFYNTGSQPITKLRFRVIEITTKNSPIYSPGTAQADLRLLDSANVMVSTSRGFLNVNGTIVDTPVKSMGSGHNASAVVVDTTLVPCDGDMGRPGCSINVQFKLGVVQTGSFRFYVEIDAM